MLKQNGSKERKKNTHAHFDTSHRKRIKERQGEKC